MKLLNDQYLNRVFVSYVCYYFFQLCKNTSKYKLKSQNLFFSTSPLNLDSPALYLEVKFRLLHALLQWVVKLCILSRMHIIWIIKFENHKISSEEIWRWIVHSSHFNAMLLYNSWVRFSCKISLIMVQNITKESKKWYNVIKSSVSGLQN